MKTETFKIVMVSGCRQLQPVLNAAIENPGVFYFIVAIDSGENRQIFELNEEIKGVMPNFKLAVMRKRDDEEQAIYTAVVKRIMERKLQPLAECPGNLVIEVNAADDLAEPIAGIIADFKCGEFVSINVIE